MRQAERTAAAPISAPAWNVSARRERIKGWNARLKWRFPARSTTAWKRRWSRLKENSKILGLLGLATKAGKAKSGEFSTEKAVKSGQASLVIVSRDASEN